MTIRELLSHPHSVALGWALLHSLWQLALVAALLASFDVLLRHRSAQARYLAATGALVLMMALPAGTLFVVRGAPAGDPPARTTVHAAAVALEPAETVGEGEPETVAPAVTPGATARRAVTAARLLAAPRVRDRLAALLPFLVAAWAAGVGVLSVRALGGWAMAQRMKRSGRPVVLAAWEESARRLARRMGLWQAVRLCESALVEVPTVIGWLRPVVLLPAGAMLGLSPAQLEALLAHELAHVRRLDYLVNLGQTLGETLLFYHPAVWWVSHRMRVEREHCCDDAAVAVGGDAVGYARALAELEGLRPAAPTLALAASGGDLWRRVARLVGGPPAHLPRAARWSAGLLAIAALGALGLSAGASLDGGTTARRRDPAGARLRPGDYGVTAEYVRGLAELGYEGLSEAKLIALRSHGVSPAYVSELKEAGYGDLSVSRLIMLRSWGVTPGYVRSLQELGYDALSPLRLVALRSNGVTPGFVEALKDFGYEGLSVSLLIGLRSSGIDPEFVHGLQDEGLEGLEVGELLALRKSGVTGQYVGKLKAAGYEDLAPATLIAFRQSGVDPKAAALREGREGEGESERESRVKPCAERKRHSGKEEQ